MKSGPSKQGTGNYEGHLPVYLEKDPGHEMLIERNGMERPKWYQCEMYNLGQCLAHLIHKASAINAMGVAQLSTLLEINQIRLQLDQWQNVIKVHY